MKYETATAVYYMILFTKFYRRHTRVCKKLPNFAPYSKNQDNTKIWKTKNGRTSLYH